MVRPHTMNGIVKDGKNYSRMVSSEEPADKKTENKIAG
jgi:hypothetical protein